MLTVITADQHLRSATGRGDDIDIFIFPYVWYMYIHNLVKIINFYWNVIFISIHIYLDEWKFKNPEYRMVYKLWVFIGKTVQ